MGVRIRLWHAGTAGSKVRRPPDPMRCGWNWAFQESPPPPLANGVILEAFLAGRGPGRGFVHVPCTSPGVSESPHTATATGFMAGALPPRGRVPRGQVVGRYARR